jgi:RNA polymerase sigma-70 factor (ECF subfamily)
MNLENYYDWLATARKFSRSPNDAEDLLQDSLMIAFRQGRLDFSIEQNRKWFSGILKNQAAMMARSESRRRVRQKLAAPTDRSTPPEDPETNPSVDAIEQLLSGLTPAAGRVMALVLAGLNRDEVCSVLNLSSAALRQRLTVIRRALKQLPQDLQREALALAYQRRTERAEDLAFGLIRRALHRLLKQPAETGAGVGTHDPDGHLIIIKSR